MTDPNKLNHLPRLLSASEVADLLQISKRTLWRLLSAGALPEPVRFGGNVRWPQHSMLDWLSQGCPKNYIARIEVPDSRET